MEPARNDTTTAMSQTRCRPAPGKSLLLCSDLLVLGDEAGLDAPRGRGSLSDAVMNAAYERRQRQRKALAQPR